MRLTLRTILFVVFVCLSAAAVAVAQEVEEPVAPGVEFTPHVVSERVVKPDNERVVRDFKPWSRPNKRQVKKILNWEQDAWGGPHLGKRVQCESEYKWNATNGQYVGLLQFGSVWNSMYPGTPRKVRLKEEKSVERKVWRVTKWSDGSTQREAIRRKTVKRAVVKKGQLPRRTSAFHGWAAVRVGQRAVSGDGPTTSWGCSL